MSQEAIAAIIAAFIGLVGSVLAALVQVFLSSRRETNSIEPRSEAFEQQISRLIEVVHDLRREMGQFEIHRSSITEQQGALQNEETTQALRALQAEGRTISERISSLETQVVSLAAYADTQPYAQRRSFWTSLAYNLAFFLFGGVVVFVTLTLVGL